MGGGDDLRGAALDAFGGPCRIPQRRLHLAQQADNHGYLDVSRQGGSLSSM